MYLFIAFIIKTFLTVFGIVLFWEHSFLNIIIPYIIGMILIIVIIISVDIKLTNQMKTKFITLRKINTPKLPPTVFSLGYLNSYSVICPFCQKYMELNHSNMIGVLRFSAHYPICVHYRGLNIYGREANYAKFVNLKYSTV